MDEFKWLIVPKEKVGELINLIGLDIRYLIIFYLKIKHDFAPLKKALRLQSLF